jgi:hypothetical protein
MESYGTLKNKERGEIAATNKKGGGLSFLFGAQCLILGLAVPQAPRA